MSNQDILLVGAGNMAIEYARVLKALGQSFVVVGRSRASADTFERATGIKPATGGIAAWLETGAPIPSHAIIATDESELGHTARLLVERGCKSLLVEKPGGLTPQDIRETARATAGVHVFVAYNRRWYASVRRAREMIREDGGVTSFTFDFTEWSHKISASEQKPETLRNWLLANSSHVIDLAFFLGGVPRTISGWRSGALPWHPAGAVFAGGGVTEAEVPFSYHANWCAPGRWGVEVMTAQHKFILRPLEKLFILNHNELTPVEEPIEDELDKKFKPGLYRQTEAFLRNDPSLLTLQTQAKHLKFYEAI